MKQRSLLMSQFKSNPKVNSLIHTVMLLSAIFLFGCNSRKLVVLEKEKTSLEKQIDSLRQINDSILNNTALLFDAALSMEEQNMDEAILIYKEISNKKDGSFWAIESEKRLSELSAKQKEVKFPGELFWLADTLELTHINAKCGEWGGDYESIRIFSKWGDRSKPKLYGYYLYRIADCERLMMYSSNDTVRTIQSKVKELTFQDISLMHEAVSDLVSYKMENNHFFTHAGVRNTARIRVHKLGDTASAPLFVSDYPSFTWNKFHKLKRQLQQ